MKETTVLSLSYGQIVVKPPEKLHGLVPASFETYQIVDPGDIIVRPTDLQNDWNSLRFGLNRHRGIITSAYMCFHTEDVMTREYGHLLLHAYDLKKVFYGLGSGLRQNLDWRDFKYLPCLVPPPDEQQTITRYLDYMDRRIRRYIRAKQKLIALLEEQKQAIIHQAVTRGLDPSVQLKPSGVAWLGDVPEHWEILRSKYLFQEIDARSVSGEEVRLSMSQRFGLIPSSELEEKRLLSESSVGGKLCKKRDLVLNRLKAHLGVFALAQQPGIVSPDYTVFRPSREIVSQYFEAVYRTPACRVELRQKAKGIVQGFWRLYTDDFYNIRMPVPPVSEQRAIMERLGTELSDLACAIDRTQREIALLREYRTRLLADVVTGQVDVRAAAAQLPGEVDETDALDEVEALDEAAVELVEDEEGEEQMDVEEETDG
ncbi:MAG TPA: restriction endonuclease subunit S [Anaerolineae bacterium]|nr:restriction endonuclease subunit S [Anaerolineae bacterium]